ncbi:hypothetical protein [Oceanobacillus bengalensis]|uniref:Uncharacterized protein n=1 Tax=Oceanobacillus bengalensis TaxID=1435466 RepID=A0A494YR02_9BACI|nr:hypothetical protein [Oceanobacillus bengalensis]RKQ11302.1 hypothetical protein D8M05_19830 [Oceanobacillus bengalensis]
MSSFTAKEATKYFRSYEVKCDEALVQEWLNNTNTRQINALVTEKHVWEFTDWWRRKGTAYEEGIDDKTKIERLLIEIQRLEKENDTIRKEKTLLELDLGISPFD